MKDTWYGDKGDLVKWGTLVHLAYCKKINKIVQVTFLRKGERPPLKTSQGEVPIADEVWEHFRNVESVQSLETSTGLDIQVITEPFDPLNRQNYVDIVTNTLRQQEHQKKVVLLDPDTGIEPQRAGAEHIKEDEICQVWDTLINGDWLVIYQHGFRRTDWRSIKKRQFERACSDIEAKVFESRKIASDVVLFAAEK